ncbi:hypothetical protein CDD81_6360 [Ophiocordyceps australis]|uniref:Uncharacterized protein n=1 Tax=Ophiocordyceps australis TaxID=1399860 RepID=A0A2C5X9H2_9HYPO|nr:hypothetical protein CDD81_6360 [Ophiocordyceps australis]
MPSLLLTLSLLVSSSMAAAVPPQQTTPSNPATALAGPPPSPVPPAQTSFAVMSGCDYAYCDGSSSWCFYWAGVTGYDPSRGPVPGEVRTLIGTCGSSPSPPASAATTTRA